MLLKKEVKKYCYMWKEGGQYSPRKYNIKNATRKGIIYPPKDPSIFEVKYPDIDIRGRVVPLF